MLSCVRLQVSCSSCCSPAAETRPSPTRSPPVATPIAIGDTVVASFTAADTLVLFSVHPSEAVEFAVFVQAEQGEFELRASDSTSGAVLTVVGRRRGPRARPSSPAPHRERPRGPGRRHPAGGPAALRVADRAALHLVLPDRSRAESVPDAMAVDVILQGEDLENSADIDEFTLQGEAGDELILFAQGWAESSREPWSSCVSDRRGREYRRRRCPRGRRRAGASLQRALVLPADGSYRIEVSQLVQYASGLTTGRGSFRILIRRIDRRPETVPALLAPGDTLQGESIAFVGDVDEFRVPSGSGQRDNLFLHMAPAVNPATVRATISRGGGQPLEVTSSTGDSALAARLPGTSPRRRRRTRRCAWKACLTTAASIAAPTGCSSTL